MQDGRARHHPDVSPHAAPNRVPFDAQQARCGLPRDARAGGRADRGAPTRRPSTRWSVRRSCPSSLISGRPGAVPAAWSRRKLARVAAANAGRYVVVKVNTDAAPELGERFSIRSIPTMSVFLNAAEIARTAGARPAADILAFVSDAVANSVHR